MQRHRAGKRKRKRTKEGEEGGGEGTGNTKWESGSNKTPINHDQPAPSRAKGAKQGQ
jgi:hypothetical protein